MSTKKLNPDDDYEVIIVPFDPRFPNTNQTRYCYSSFVDYHRCRRIRGEEYEPCNYFMRVVKGICPNAWVDKWNDQIERGCFAGDL